MTSPNFPETRSELSNNPTVHTTTGDTSWQRQGKLWSNLKELCELLRIPATSSVNDEEFLFQHVQFKTDRKSTRLNSSHTDISRMPSSA